MVDEALARELIDMTDGDRRLQAGALGDDLSAQLTHRRVTTRNGDRLAAILDEYGWPTAELVDGAPLPWPCRDPGRMDELRAEVGLDPFAVYVAKHAPA
ncbi:hypothetical protein Ait01nite_034940 [Actinoplanes italicus]|uniref:Uncharacterized protein n=1 Tax=Actinoplanes italicus TaxID=113567 RepID=A0A2T0K8Z7_9ACTN|nr:hypothetical protein [Actinoplanes italicus]PRX19537.1 hypothetical protein CLV67_110289 [Actinoplanes italicus]GIE30449.1 hypothetical protein Ait01nite_034940 [Actinoplanes italicus]